LILIGLVLILGGLMIWRHWWLLDVVGWGALLVLAVKQQRPDWRLTEAIWAGGCTVIQAPLRAMGHWVARMKTRGQHQDEDQPIPKSFPFKVILIPLGVCVFFLAIFSAANPVVARILQNLLLRLGDFFANIQQYLNPTRVLVWGLWFVLFAGLIRAVAHSAWADWFRQQKDDLQPDGQADQNGDYLAAFITLILVNLLFLAYNFMDSIYLYFKATLPHGITWTDDTHAGCGWLTFALMISSVVTGYFFRNRLVFHPRAGWLKGLSSVWAVQNVILGIGSLRRLAMYIDYSGLTHLRITGLYGSVLVVAGVGLMAYKVYANRSFFWLIRSYVTAFCLGLVLLAVTPDDWICATYNVNKVIEGKPRALRPLCQKELSPEALPALIPLLDYKRVDQDAGKEKKFGKELRPCWGGIWVNSKTHRLIPGANTRCLGRGL
jgi:hypothetical protein